VELSPSCYHKILLRRISYQAYLHNGGKFHICLLRLGHSELAELGMSGSIPRGLRSIQPTRKRIEI